MRVRITDGVQFLSRVNVVGLWVCAFLSFPGPILTAGRSYIYILQVGNKANHPRAIVVAGAILQTYVLYSHRSSGVRQLELIFLALHQRLSGENKASRWLCL